VRPAVASDGEQVPAADHLVSGAQPLLCAVNVVRPLASVEQPAQATLDDRQLLHTATADRRQRLIEMRHSLLDQTREHEHHPERRDRLALQVAVASRTSQLDRLRVEAPLLVEVRTTPRLLEPRPPRRSRIVRLGQERRCLPDPALVDGPLTEDPASEPPDRPRCPAAARRSPLSR
jgi:hypothetical protein